MMAGRTMGSPCPARRVGELGEQDDPLRALHPALGDVVGVVEPDADDLAGAQDRRREADAGGVNAGLGAGRQLASGRRRRAPGEEPGDVVQPAEVRSAAAAASSSTAVNPLPAATWREGMAASARYRAASFTWGSPLLAGRRAGAAGTDISLKIKYHDSNMRRARSGRAGGACWLTAAGSGGARGRRGAGHGCAGAAGPRLPAGAGHGCAAAGRSARITLARR